MRNNKGQFLKGHTEGVRFGFGQSFGDKSKYIKIGLAQIGKKVSLTTRKKLSQAHLGKPAWNKGIKGSVKANSGSFTTGKTFGKNNINWRGGISKESDKIRHSIEGKLWVDSVFARDGYTCQKTGMKGCKLASHHILNFAQYPELRFAIDNGITLSDKTHREFHKIYGRKKNVYNLYWR